MNKKILGFSLIELMVVIAIIGVLSAVAMPNYRDYVTRGRLATAMPILSSLKTKATDYYNTHGIWPTTLVDIDVPNATAFNAAKHVANVGISPNGCAAATNFAGSFCLYLDFDNALVTGLESPRLMFTAETVGELLIWYCTTSAAGDSQSIPQKYLPGGCELPT